VDLLFSFPDFGGLGGVLRGGRFCLVCSFDVLLSITLPCFGKFHKKAIPFTGSANIELLPVKARRSKWQKLSRLFHWVVSPAPAIGRRWSSAQRQKQQQDKQDDHAVVSSRRHPVFRASARCGHLNCHNAQESDGNGIASMD
jgi:hypothetical protein